VIFTKNAYLFKQKSCPHFGHILLLNKVRKKSEFYLLIKTKQKANPNQIKASTITPLQTKPGPIFQKVKNRSAVTYTDTIIVSQIPHTEETSFNCKVKDSRECQGQAPWKC